MGSITCCNYFEEGQLLTSKTLLSVDLSKSFTKKAIINDKIDNSNSSPFRIRSVDLRTTDLSKIFRKYPIHKDLYESNQYENYNDYKSENRMKEASLSGKISFESYFEDNDKLKLIMDLQRKAKSFVENPTPVNENNLNNQNNNNVQMESERNFISQRVNNEDLNNFSRCQTISGKSNFEQRLFDKATKHVIEDLKGRNKNQSVGLMREEGGRLKLDYSFKEKISKGKNSIDFQREFYDLSSKDISLRNSKLLNNKNNFFLNDSTVGNFNNNSRQVFRDEINKNSVILSEKSLNSQISHRDSNNMNGKFTLGSTKSLKYDQKKKDFRGNQGYQTLNYDYLSNELGNKEKRRIKRKEKSEIKAPHKISFGQFSSISKEDIKVSLIENKNKIDKLIG